jgi:hypothetical protein
LVDHRRPLECGKKVSHPCKLFIGRQAVSLGLIAGATHRDIVSLDISPALAAGENVILGEHHSATAGLGIEVQVARHIQIVGFEDVDSSLNAALHTDSALGDEELEALAAGLEKLPITERNALGPILLTKKRMNFSYGVGAELEHEASSG